jgi:cysteinylglycine-S-conjugate dipeptidase
MPELRCDLEALVRIRSVSAPGRIDQPLLDAFELTSRLFAKAGVAVGRLDLAGIGSATTGGSACRSSRCSSSWRCSCSPVVWSF